MPAEGGLFLTARDAHGRMRERLVTDADGAGVLVASWIAVDTLADPPPPRALPAPEADVAAPPQTHWRPRSLLLTGLAGVSDGGAVTGLRGEIDIIRAGNWRFGVATAMQRGMIRFNAVGPMGSIVTSVDTTDYAALVYGVRPVELGNWLVRPAVAVGAISTTAHVAFTGTPQLVMNGDTNAVLPVVEVSLVGVYDLGDGFGFAVGPIIELMDQHISRSDGETGEQFDRTLQLLVSIGIQHAL